MAGSMALYGLGKLHNVLASHDNSTIRAARPKAVGLLSGRDFGLPPQLHGRRRPRRPVGPGPRRRRSTDVGAQPGDSTERGRLARFGDRLSATRPGRFVSASPAAMGRGHASRGEPAGPSASRGVGGPMGGSGRLGPATRRAAPVPLRTPPRVPSAKATSSLLRPESSEIVLCQALGPAAPCPICED